MCRLPKNMVGMEQPISQVGPLLVCTLHSKGIHPPMGISCHRYQPKKKKFWSMLSFAALWSIWIYRNDNVFEKRQTKTEDLFPIIITRTYFWFLAMDETFPFKVEELIKSSSGIRLWIKPKQKLPTSEWTSPPEGFIKWNTDGAYLPKDIKSGIGGVLRDKDGRIICIFSGPSSANDVDSAEIEAIRRAVSLLGEKDFHQNLVIESDSKTVISWLQNPEARPWRREAILDEIEDHLKKLNAVIFMYTRKEANMVAHQMAKQGVHRTQDFLAWL